MHLASGALYPLELCLRQSSASHTFKYAVFAQQIAKGGFLYSCAAYERTVCSRSNDAAFAERALPGGVYQQWSFHLWLARIDENIQRTS